MILPGRRLADGIFYGGVIVVLVLLYLIARRDVTLTAGLRALGLGVLSVGVLATVTCVVWRLWSRPVTPTARELARRLEDVRYMGGTQFEAFVADIFLAMGYESKRIGGMGDQGVDIVLNPRGECIAVQCKNHARPVGNKPVQEVYAGARHHRCAEAWVVAPAGYTRGALQLAGSTHVSLYDAGSLQCWIRSVDTLEKGRAGGIPRETEEPITKPAFAGRDTPETANGVVRHPHRDYQPER